MQKTTNYRTGLRKLFNQVSNNEPINPLKLNEFLAKNGLPQLMPIDYTATKIPNKPLYRLSNLCPQKTAQIEAFLRLEEGDRISLAGQNRSHDALVPEAMLLYRHGLNHPHVIICDQDDFYPKVYRSNECLIIENSLNFIRIKDTLGYLMGDCFTDPLIDLDIYWGEGKGVTNRLFNKVLSQYETIHLHLDLDLGGVQIARALIKSIPDRQIKFLIPKTAKTLMSSVVIAPAPDYLDQLIESCNGFEELKSLKQLVLETRRTIEQEAFLCKN